MNALQEYLMDHYGNKINALATEPLSVLRWAGELWCEFGPEIEAILATEAVAQGMTPLDLALDDAEPFFTATISDLLTSAAVLAVQILATQILEDEENDNEFNND